MKKIISKTNVEGKYWDCVIEFEQGPQMKCLLKESEIKKMEVIEKLIPITSEKDLNVILKDLDDLLQLKYEEGMDEVSENAE